MPLSSPIVAKRFFKGKKINRAFSGSKWAEVSKRNGRIYKVAGSSEPSSYTFTAQDQSTWFANGGGVIIAYSGAKASAPIDVSNCDNSVSGPGSGSYFPISPSITTNYDFETVLVTTAVTQNTTPQTPQSPPALTSRWSLTDATVGFVDSGSDLQFGKASTTLTVNWQYNGGGVFWVACQIAIRPGP